MATLNALILLPLLGAVVVALLPRGRADLLRAVAALSTVSTLAVAVYMVTQFKSGEAGYQYVVNQSWIRDFGISWHLGVDGISLWMVALTALIFPIACFGPPIKHDPKPYLAWLLVLQAGVMGSFLSLDLFLFFVFFEIVLVPMYFLISGWGYDNRVYASLKFFIYTLTGSAFLFVGIVSLAALHQRATGTWTFDLAALGTGAGVTSMQATMLFFAFGIGFAVKVPLFPLHTWLPDAHTQAPTAGSVILAAVLLKLGTYGFIRYSLFLFPEASVHYAPLLLTLAAVGIIYTAIVAAMQKDLKRLIAYSSVAHLGFIVLGTFALTTQGLSGAVIQMVNHGVSTGALFLLVGMISDRRHTREIANLRGILKATPVLGGVFLVVMFSSVGLPGLNGFVGEFLVLLGTFLTHRWWAIVAASGVIFAAVYLLWAFQRSFHGEPDAETAKMADLNRWEKFQLAPLLVLIVFFGVYPKPILERIQPSVDALIAHVEMNSPYVAPAVSQGTETGKDSTVTPDEGSDELVNAQTGEGDTP